VNSPDALKSKQATIDNSMINYLKTTYYIHIYNSSASKRNLNARDRYCTSDVKIPQMIFQEWQE